MRKCQTLKPNGYTLLSMMIALTSLTLIALVVSNLATTTFNHHQYEEIDRKDVWLFFAQLQKEITTAKNFSISGDELIFELNGDAVDYKLYDTNIRRRLNSSGYDIVLQNVQALSFQNNSQDITIDLTDMNGRFYRWRVKKVIQ